MPCECRWAWTCVLCNCTMCTAQENSCAQTEKKKKMGECTYHIGIEPSCTAFTDTLTLNIVSSRIEVFKTDIIHWMCSEDKLVAQLCSFSPSQSHTHTQHTLLASKGCTSNAFASVATTISGTVASVCTVGKK